MKYYNKEQLKAALADCNRRLNFIYHELEALKAEVRNSTPDNIDSLEQRLRGMKKDLDGELLNATALRNLLNKQAA